MAKLEEDFKRHLQGRRFFNKDDTVIVAVSTGVDSMALLHLLEGLPATMRPRIVVAHVNHELRKESTVEEQFIRNYCEKHDLSLVVAHWPVDQHPVTGVEEAARQFRYHFFAQVMRRENAPWLLTAHHQNDLAETMLMKLTRGGQLNQLVGIASSRPFANGQLIRPLLPFSKNRLLAYARDRHLKWYEDNTNHDLAITRNRYRHEIIPALEKENPRLLDHLSSYHQQLADLLAWQDQELASQLKQVTSKERLSLTRWRHLAALTQKLVLQRWLEQSVKGVKQSLLSELITALNNPATPQQHLQLPGKRILVKDYDWCFISTEEKMTERVQNNPVSVVELGQWYFVNHQQLLVSPTLADFGPESKTQEMWLAPRQFPLSLRQWQEGDTIRLKNGGRQKVRRVLIDQKVPNDQRQLQQVLVDAEGEVVWLIGRKWSWFDRPAGFRQKWRKVIIGIKDK